VFVGGLLSLNIVVLCVCMEFVYDRRVQSEVLVIVALRQRRRAVTFSANQGDIHLYIYIYIYI